MAFTHIKNGASLTYKVGVKKTHEVNTINFITFSCYKCTTRQQLLAVFFFACLLLCLYCQAKTYASQSTNISGYVKNFPSYSFESEI